MLAVVAASLPLPSWPLAAQQRGATDDGEDDPQCRRQREAALISGEIVVCAGRGRQDEFRVRAPERARSEYAAATMDKGQGRKPAFEPLPCKPSLLTFCPRFGGTPPRAVEVDFSKLPEAPPGLDAARPNEEAPKP